MNGLDVNRAAVPLVLSQYLSDKQACVLPRLGRPQVSRACNALPHLKMPFFRRRSALYTRSQWWKTLSHGNRAQLLSLSERYWVRTCWLIAQPGDSSRETLCVV